MSRSSLTFHEPRSDRGYVDQERTDQEDPVLPDDPLVIVLHDHPHLIAYGPRPGISLPDDLIGMYYLN